MVTGPPLAPRVGADNDPLVADEPPADGGAVVGDANEPGDLAAQAASAIGSANTIKSASAARAVLPNARIPSFLSILTHRLIR
ncbi:MAG: hypothetical protein FWD74_12810 [Actinomycetia bacterium]|nr:hypothetical protein [Actinomycetes bacterium]